VDRVVVVGSGASGVHFAQTLLARGREVTLVDVGRPGLPQVLPEASLNGLKETLPDPVGYFLGDRFQGVLLPGKKGEYYGIPPSKGHALEGPDGYGFDADGFAPLFSLAQGGLAEVWTGGCYPFDDEDLRAWPLGWREMAPHYAEVARRIGVTGTEDALSAYLPLHEGLQAPLRLDAHAARLLARADTHGGRLAALGCRVGRARIAVLSEDRPGRKACTYLGRCLWGCPHDALYTPAVTLRECLGRPGFRYLEGREVLHFTASSGGRIHSLHARRAADGVLEEVPLDRLVLAAGTLGSARILLESLRRAGQQAPVLSGLMDNRQVLLPFLHWRMVGRVFEDESYQYHQLALALDAEDPADRVFGLVTTLKTCLTHPIAQSVPLHLRAALDVTRAAHAGLGILNVNFRDTRRPGNTVGLVPGSARPRLAIRYAPAPEERTWLQPALRRVRGALRALGCLVPPGFAYVRPMGASAHYAGLVPMAREGGAGTATPEGRSRDFANLWLADGITFPFLPAKNLTFTLMANAVRIASAEF